MLLDLEIIPENYNTFTIKEDQEPMLDEETQMLKTEAIKYQK